jgi:hemerythrin-like domain-containing protein
MQTFELVSCCAEILRQAEKAQRPGRQRELALSSRFFAGRQLGTPLEGSLSQEPTHFDKGGTMDALRSLKSDHTIIAEVVDALEQFGRRLHSGTETGGEENREGLQKFVRFISEYGQMVHQVKEEELLLPTLTKAGLEWDTGPIAKVRHEHEHERYFVDVLRNASLQQTPWGPEDRRRLEAAITDFVDFQRRHMREEDLYLYPVASSGLSKAQLDELNAQLETYDRDHVDVDKHEELRQLGHSLSECFPRSRRPETLQTQSSQVSIEEGGVS